MVQISLTEAANIWPKYFSAKVDDSKISNFFGDHLEFVYILNKLRLTESVKKSTDPEDYSYDYIDVTYPHHYFVNKSGVILCIGNNAHGLLGCKDSETVSFLDEKCFLLNLCGKKIIDLKGGSVHMLALTEDGELYSWGTNNHGQLGTGGFGEGHRNEYNRYFSYYTPQRVYFKSENENEPKIKLIACTNLKSFAIDEESTVYEWGTWHDGEWGWHQRVPVERTIPDLDEPLIDIEVKFLNKPLTLVPLDSLFTLV